MSERDKEIESVRACEKARRESGWAQPGSHRQCPSAESRGREGREDLAGRGSETVTWGRGLGGAGQRRQRDDGAACLIISPWHDAKVFEAEK